MKLNHLNLTVTDVRATSSFLEPISDCTALAETLAWPSCPTTMGSC